MYPLEPFQLQNPFVPMMQVPQVPLSQTSIKYVNGKQAVENQQMAVNSSDVFIDSSAKKFYTKQTDATGNATIKCYDYTESEDEKPIEYITRAEFESFKEKMKGVKKHEFEHESNVRSSKQQNSNAGGGGNDEG